MARYRLFYLAALTGAFVFHMFYIEWFSWFLLILLAALPLFSLLLSLPAMLSARLTLTGSAATYRGGIIQPQLHLQTRFPAGLCFVRLKNPEGSPKKRSRRIYLAPGSLPLPAQAAPHCGLARTELAKARILDYLGLFSFPVKMPAPLVTEILPLSQAPNLLPDVSALLSPPLRPKNGGGFSEIHELRSYRPGDAMRDVHWKLSAKSDDLIVREAQEEVRTEAILTLNLNGPGFDADSVLDQLSFLSGYLLSKELPHTVWCFCGAADPISAPVHGEEDLRALLSRLLRQLPGITPQEGLPAPTPAPGGWCYPIIPAKREAAP